MEKVSIAEILKNCPQGMKLYSPMCGECILDSVDDSQYAITVRVEDDRLPYYLTADGRYLDVVDAECVLFPSKDQRDWSKFQRPFKVGDVVISGNGRANEVVAIFKNNKSYLGNNGFNYYALISLYTEKQTFKIDDWACHINTRFATEEEKQKLFNAIKENGYRWNTETKTLEKLIEPKFKIGNKVRNKNNHNVIFTITSIEEDSYVCGAKAAFWFDDQDNYELVPNKFDINTLKPFDNRVLVRDYSYGVWRVSFWGCLINNACGYIYDTTRGCYKQCIPFEGNEHLLGKTDDCDAYYKTWED